MTLLPKVIESCIFSVIGGYLKPREEVCQIECTRYV